MSESNPRGDAVGGPAITRIISQVESPNPAGLEPLNQEAGFSGVDAPAQADLYRCVHCGLCLSSCPTYSVLQLETESPRGRIALMRAVHEGRAGISDRIVSHWEKCLQCRACEAVCPSGVPYGRIMEYTRAQTLAQDKQGRSLKQIDRFFLRAALPHPRRLRFGARLLQLYQRSGLRKLVRGSGALKLLPKSLAELEGQLPELKGPFFGPSKAVYPPQLSPQLSPQAPPQPADAARLEEGHPALASAASAPEGTGERAGKIEKAEKARKVGLLSGCVMPLMQGETMYAAVRVLTRNGCAVAVPPGQVCCGALNLHAGDLATARRLARRNIDVFLSAGADKPGFRIITASAGCGSNMKEYGELLKDDPEYAESARRFSALTADITEFLAELPWQPPLGRIERRITYQDPCHLAHAQRISSAPRALLRSIPGLELVEMEGSTMCCGGAGFYASAQPELARRILDAKLKNINATGAEQVATANPGCMLQIEQGLGAAAKGNDQSAAGQPSAAVPAAAMPVKHVVDLLDEAYRAEASPGG